MNRQPPAFLERLVARLIPAASREHVLGDLAERYTSPSQYFFDATRTIPFVVAARVRRSAVTADVQPAIRVVLLLTMGGIVFSLVKLQYGDAIVQWYPSVCWLFTLFAGFVNSKFVNPKLGPFHVSYGNLFMSSPSIQKRALARGIAELQIIMKFGPFLGVGFIVLASMPLLSKVWGWTNSGRTSFVDGGSLVYAASLAVLAACFVLAARMHVRRCLRNFQQKLDSLD